ncbi:hypothetical protein [Mucilaginibacter psychrotolerans]|uniref:DUF4163 domain-containing protein n=1 Tax=Mucilaginibacter psychrotolerans TaxID=1524096 RepID=A0A4Y8S834_9SPHI|nr:hypothetical protein [Mucilaginibacter psychrotolerans]TFF34801.1 hypothetical protein E2R66_20675 [Mucilaginibacter psychrotolerans]
MKKALLFLLLPAMLALAACNKAVLQDNGCVTEYIRPLNPVGDAAYAKIKTLFQNNGISYQGLSFYRADFNDNIPLNGVINVYQHTVAMQYFNGLPLLNGDIGYHFMNGVFTTTISPRYSSINIGTGKHLQLSQVRKLFLDEIQKDGFYANRSYKDSCMSAEFGYYNVTPDGPTPTPQFIKAWKITPSGSDYPVAYFRDDDAAMLSYFNGIFTVN